MADKDRPVISYGGGVNSTALAILLIRQGVRDGLALFADTGAEWPETYEFVFGHFRPYLEEHGWRLVIIGAEFRSRRYFPPLVEVAERDKMIPLARVRWCTTEYKIRPLKRWCRANGVDFNRMPIGIAADEAHRQPDKNRPLVDWRITRDDCARVIAQEGLPIPRKSGCWLCPFQRRTQWVELSQKHPELFERAMQLEQITGATFDPSGEFSLKDYVSQMVLFDFSEFYQPCLCRV